MEVLPVKVFTKENPCTKVDIHNCFVGESGKYEQRPVVQARGVIGLNTPKYLIREGYAVYTYDKGIDYIHLTQNGEHWLRLGLERFLELHPERRVEVRNGKPSSPVRRVARRTA